MPSPASVAPVFHVAVRVKVMLLATASVPLPLTVMVPEVPKALVCPATRMPWLM